MVGRLFAGVLVAACLVTGCHSGFLAYDERGNGPIAAAIRDANAPGVDSVDRSFGDYMDSATINISMLPDTTRDQALHVLCDVAIPARDAGDPSDGLSINVWQDGRIVASDIEPSDCFSRPSPGPSRSAAPQSPRPSR